VTGLVVTMIGLALVKVGIQYAAGGVPAIGNQPEYGSLLNWSAALVVILVTLGLKFFTRGHAVGLGGADRHPRRLSLCAGDGHGDFEGIAGSWERASYFAAPIPFKYGLRVQLRGDHRLLPHGLRLGGRNRGRRLGHHQGRRRARSDRPEIEGATFADGLGTAVAGVFGGLPNTSFSQNVGLIAMTGVMSRHVVTIGALFLIVCGLSPRSAR
jgi:xanthine/uracil permease